MNHVFSVTCCRSGQSLRASGQQPLLSAICRTRRNWFGTRNAEPLEGACKSSIRREWSSTWEYKHSSIQDSKAATNRTKIFTIKAREAPRSFFHSSATFSKAKKSAKQPPRRPPQRQVTPGSSQILPSKNKPSSSTQNLPHKTRDKRNLPPYLPPQDLNPSGKPIYSGSQEWEDCVKNVSLDPPSKDEAEKIFGEVLPVKEALEILKVLQYQRLSGTLDHAIAAPQVTANLVANALQFLREKYPFDEDAAIMARIEREYDAEESQVADVDGKPAYVPQQDAEKTGVYGTPSFDSIVAERRAKLEQKEAERAKEAAEKGEEAGPLAVRQTFREKALAVRQQESAEWVRKYKEKALLSEGPPPDVPVRRRLLPSAMFTLITILCCLTFATFYIPPPRAARLFPDTPPAASTVLALIAVNAVVFVAWRVPPMWRFMNTHFILVAGAPTVSSLLGCMFSHHRFSHFFFNMTALWFVGTWCKYDCLNRVYMIANEAVKYMMTLDAQTSSQHMSVAVCSLHSLPYLPSSYADNSTYRHWVPAVPYIL